MFILEKRRLKGDLITVYTFQRWGSAGKVLISLVASSKTHRNAVKLHQGMFRWGARKRLFTQRVSGLWNRLSRRKWSQSKLVRVQGASGGCS